MRKNKTYIAVINPPKITTIIAITSIVKNRINDAQLRVNIFNFDFLGTTTSKPTNNIANTATDKPAEIIPKLAALASEAADP